MLHLSIILKRFVSMCVTAIGVLTAAPNLTKFDTRVPQDPKLSMIFKYFKYAEVIYVKNIDKPPFFPIFFSLSH